MNIRFTLSVFLLILIASWITPAQTISGDIPALSKKADIILTGKVINRKSEWNKNKTRIFTEITINVDEYIKGQNNGSTISFKQPGGEVGEIGELYTHVPTFDNNEEVLLFMKNKGNAGLDILDGPSGKMTLYRDEKTGEKITAQNKKLAVLKEQIKNSIR